MLVSFGGGSWDITYHLLNIPETFFSPPHGLVYAGILMVIFTFYTNLRQNLGIQQSHRQKQKKRQDRWSNHSSKKNHSVDNEVALVLSNPIDNNTDKNNKHRVGSLITFAGTLAVLAAGPFDFGWHSVFGLDGLLSPPHLTLSSGWLLIGIGITKNSLDGLNGANNEKQIQSKTKSPGNPNPCDRDKLLKKAEMILELAFILMIMSGLIYFFSLPFSETEYYNFNPDPVAGLLVHAIGYPILFSWFFTSIYRVFKNEHGIITLVGVAYAAVMLLTQVASNKFIADSSLFFFLVNITPFAIIDLAINKKGKTNFRRLFARDGKISQNLEKDAFTRRAIARYMTGGIILALFAYLLGFPLNVYIYNEVFYGYQISQDMLMGIYQDNMADNYFFIILFSVSGGILGSAISLVQLKRKKRQDDLKR
ncbi:MAG: hypothetical protein M3162_07070 [Thermoproteota archaeon]|nr:hypothetical protein [Thermoproteota archaeon]